MNDLLGETVGYTCRSEVASNGKNKTKIGAFTEPFSLSMLKCYSFGYYLLAVIGRMLL